MRRVCAGVRKPSLTAYERLSRQGKGEGQLMRSACSVGIASVVLHAFQSLAELPTHSGENRRECALTVLRNGRKQSGSGMGVVCMTGDAARPHDHLHRCPSKHDKRTSNTRTDSLR